MFVRKTALLSLVFCLSVLLLHCAGKKSNIPEESVLVQIGNKVLTTDEFIQRAEYTIRPRYCKMDNYIHKKIVLNSLIGEKLLAMETDENNPLRKNETFRAYIQGRKEQAMRQLMYIDEAYDKVTVDTAEIQKEFRVMGRKYKLSYFNVTDTTHAKIIQDSLNTGRFDLNSIIRHFGGSGTLPQREVTWKNKEEKQIHEALFKNKVTKNQVIGPLEVEKGDFLFIQVDGWTDNVVMTDQSTRQRWEDAKERLHDEKAEARWIGMVQKIMDDKKLEFVEDTFWKLNQLYYDMYMVTEQEKQDDFNRRLWEKEDVERALDNIPEGDELLNYPFFKLDGKIWTVRDFKNLVASHPLVFRKKRMKKAEFPEQFKYAIADLLRDKFVTDKAYQKGYDKRFEVQQNAAMWEDASLAMYQRNAYLKKIGASKDFNVNNEKTIKNYLNPYVDSLQTKYSTQIKINFKAFEKLKLTRIDMLAQQLDQPYPVVVPFFPIVTTDNRLDYGSKLEP